MFVGEFHVVAPALTGHTRAFSPEPLVVGTDILHVPDCPRSASAPTTLNLGAVPVTRAGAGTCTADVVIPAAGRVEVQVGMRRSQFENPVATLTFHIPGP